MRYAFSPQPKSLTRLENLDELLMKGKRVCYTVVIYGLYQHFAEIITIFYSLQKGTRV
jgi:hypothetical protein